MKILCIELRFYGATTMKTEANTEQSNVFPKRKGMPHQTLKPAVNLYQQKKHINIQIKLKLLHLIQALNQNIHMHSHPSYLYIDRYGRRITLVN